MIRILAGIPSIIYGFFALYTVVKILESGLKMSAGESVLAASLILSVMILPFFYIAPASKRGAAKAKFQDKL